MSDQSPARQDRRVPGSATPLKFTPSKDQPPPEKPVVWDDEHHRPSKLLSLPNLLIGVIFLIILAFSLSPVYFIFELRGALDSGNSEAIPPLVNFDSLSDRVLFFEGMTTSSPDPDIKIKANVRKSEASQPSWFLESFSSSETFPSVKQSPDGLIKDPPRFPKCNLRGRVTWMRYNRMGEVEFLTEDGVTIRVERTGLFKWRLFDVVPPENRRPEGGPLLDEVEDPDFPSED